MIVDERLTVHRALARVRVVESVNLALEESEPSKGGIEVTLQEQLGDGRQLLEMAEAACYLASVARLQPDTHKHMVRTLNYAVQAFRDLQEMVANWMQKHNMSLVGEQELSPLIAKMEQFRTELVSSVQQRQGVTAGDRAAFPKPGTTDWGEMNRKRAELICKKIRGELSESEREEYEILQRFSLAEVEASFPQQGKAKPEENTEASGG